MKLFKLSASTLATATALTMAQSALAQDLKIQSFLAKPEHFGVTSTLIEGDKEVLLVNAQFQNLKHYVLLQIFSIAVKH